MHSQDEIFYGRYRLLESYGKGGFSTVWKALDLKSDSIVALKIFVKQDKQGIELCRMEYKKSVELSHANILRPIFFDDENGIPFLVMPFCQHGTTEPLTGNMDERQVAVLMEQVASALSYIHNRTNPIVHNDVKPDNLLVGDSGEYLLSDFGISEDLHQKFTMTVGSETEAANEGAAKRGFTPVAYRAPEFFPQKGQRKGIPSPASDIWSLGATLFHLASGELPFNGQGGLAQQIGMGTGKSNMDELLEDLPAHFSDGFYQWVKACLSLEPTNRPTSEQVSKAAKLYLETGRWLPLPQKYAAPAPDSQLPPKGGFDVDRIGTYQPSVKPPFPIWAIVILGVLLVAAVGLAIVAGTSKDCSDLEAEADAMYSEKKYREAANGYREAETCLGDSSNTDLVDKIKSADAWARILTYEKHLPPTEGFAAVAGIINGKLKWGYFDTVSLQLAIPLRYDSAAAFNGNGNAEVWKDGDKFMIDNRGDVVEEKVVNPTNENEDVLQPPSINPNYTDQDQDPSPSLKLDLIDFGISKKIAYTGDEIKFTDKSSPTKNIKTRTWQFGDGTTSNTKAGMASHTYSQPDDYTIKLCINGEQQCESKSIKILKKRIEFKNKGTTGAPSSELSKCRSQYGGDNFTADATQVRLNVKQPLKLKSAKVFANMGGTVKIELKNAAGVIASFEKQVNKGESPFDFEPDFDDELPPGDYTLQITPVRSAKKGTTPQLERGCGNGTYGNSQMGINNGKDMVLFDLEYNY